MLLKLFVLFSTFSQISLAQLVFIQDESIPVHLTQIEKTQRRLEFGTPRANVITDTYLPLHMRESLNRFADIEIKQCDSEESYAFALSLSIKGNFPACIEYVDRCLKAAPKSIKLPVIIQGARCAAFEYNYQKAFDLLTIGTQADDFNGERASALVLEFAVLARNTSFSEQTERIIALNPKWSASERTLALGLVQMMSAGLPSEVSKKQVFEFVDREIAASNEFYKRYLKSLRITLYSNDFQTQKAYEFLVQDAASLMNPLDWWQNGFSILYEMANGIDFSQAKNLYLSFLPFAHPRSVLPKESNVHTYTEIYNDVCNSNMLQAEELNDFKKQLNLWKSGKLPLNALVNYFRAKPATWFEKSDFLSTYASLLAMNGEFGEAEKYYWQAHLRCPYNNRSHWGLTLLSRRKKYLSFPEYKDNENYLNATIKDISFPPETDRYFSNWSSLPVNSQQRVKFAARIWAPYIKGMFERGNFSYIKLPFEILSAAPGLSELRDARIGPPNMPNYLYDNRLWDDVRGAGGKSVAADHDEVFQTVHGDYNLLGHEMAHQFHAFVAKLAPNLNRCIDRLYAGALKRDVFSDGYAKSTVKEYFAQGITHFLISPKMPARYGLNASWFEKNDPDLYKLMSSIQNSNGDLKKIVCP